MEHIRNALRKAHVSLDEDRDAAPEPIARIQPKRDTDTLSPNKSDAPREETVQRLRDVSLDPEHLERNRIVSLAMNDPNHVAFNLLRTRVRKVMDDNRWKSLAITSPTPDCGKTTVCLNLAFSLARTPNCRTVVVDLDLKKPSIARMLGIEATGSVGQFLQGTAEARDCFVQVDDNLVFGLNSDRLRHSSELIQGPRMSELLEFVSSLSPDIVLFDLPPMRTGDDALSFLPRVDAALLIAAAGASTVAEIDECEQQISHLEKFLGIVMNKAETSTKDYYY